MNKYLDLKRWQNFLIEKSRPLLGEDRYRRWSFRINVGYPLDLEAPVTYNQKLQWLKLYYHRPEFTRLVDKHAVKEYVASIIGDEYVIPSYGVWDSFDEIDFDSLPDRFVLKTTHDSGGVVICKDKSTFDKVSARKKLNKSLNRDYYKYSEEWYYRDVPHRIIAEKYMEDESGELRDYKIFCFDGTVKALFIATDRFNKKEETKFDFFDENFNHLPFTNGHPNAKTPIAKPANFEEMKAIAAKLSAGIPHVRVDLYSINGKIYFGEMTFFHWSGFKPFVPEIWDYKFGEWIDLPKEKIL